MKKIIKFLGWLFIPFLKEIPKILLTIVTCFLLVIILFTVIGSFLMFFGSTGTLFTEGSLYSKDMVGHTLQLTLYIISCVVIFSLIRFGKEIKLFVLYLLSIGN